MLNLDTHILLQALSGDLTSKKTKVLTTNLRDISIPMFEATSRRIRLRRRTVPNDSKPTQTLADIQPWALTAEICRPNLYLDCSRDP